jgi:hypothetical protein
MIQAVLLTYCFERILLGVREDVILGIGVSFVHFLCPLKSVVMVPPFFEMLATETWGLAWTCGRVSIAYFPWAISSHTNQPWQEVQVADVA